MGRTSLARSAAFFCSAVAPASLCGRGPAAERAHRTFLQAAVARRSCTPAGRQLPSATRTLRSFGSQGVRRTAAGIGAENEARSGDSSAENEARGGNSGAESEVRGDNSGAENEAPGGKSGAENEARSDDSVADQRLQTQPAKREPDRKARERQRSRRSEILDIMAQEEVVLPSYTSPREVGRPYMPEGMAHWTPKPAPPRVITTPHMDAKLPEPPTKAEKNFKTALIVTSLFTFWGVAMVFTDNYVKVKSTIVDGILFMVRNDEVAASYLGPHVGFANHYFPWVDGTVQQVKGKVDVSFKVKGDIGTGVVRFLARRKQAKGNRPGNWVTLEFSLTMPSGEKIDISQAPELKLEESDLK